MPEIVDQAIVQWTGRCVFESQICLLTMHYRMTTSGGTVWDQNPAFLAWFNLMETLGGVSNSYPDVLSTGALGIEWWAQTIFPQRYMKTIWAPAFSSGSVAGARMPPNVACSLMLRGDFANKRNRGVKHIGCVPAVHIDGGFVTNTGKVAIGALAEAMQASIDVLGDGTLLAQPIIYHRAAPAISALVTNYLVGETSRVERRRTVGLGI